MNNTNTNVPVPSLLSLARQIYRKNYVKCSYYRKKAVRYAAGMLKKLPHGSRVVLVLKPNQFLQDTNSWGPFLDGSTYTTGIVAGEEGARKVEFINTDEGRIDWCWEGDIFPAQMKNGKITRRGY